jgi:surfeit locus 1 family protein
MRPEQPLPLTFAFQNGRWAASWFMTALTAAAVLAFLQLGRWQWHRAEYKRHIAAEFSAGNQTPQPLGDRSTAAVPRYTQVRVRGSYDPVHQFLLENLSHDGEPGYQVLTPLQLDDGRVLLVNRGWLPLTRSRQEMPDIHLGQTSGVEVSGRLDALPVAGISLGRLPPPAGSPWPKLASFPTMTDLSVAFGRPLEAQQLLLNAGEPQGYVRDWHVGGIGPERHIAYAVQWWAFALLALILYVRLNWQRRPAVAP